MNQIVNNNLTEIETLFNMLGSLPVIGMVSGSVRVTAGAVQTVSAVIFATASFIAKSCVSNLNERAVWADRTEIGVNHIYHGIGNIFRGAVEGIMSFTLIGSVCLFVVQIASERKFQPLVLQY